ncbi:hypothetical protein XF36_17470 [Pseudonocardia sp. HH130629-09]|nr:hypothetical protein XF36_17470 [Pseudonocardia sp. HH130629-09]
MLAEGDQPAVVVGAESQAPDAGVLAVGAHHEVVVLLGAGGEAHPGAGRVRFERDDPVAPPVLDAVERTGEQRGEVVAEDLDVVARDRPPGESHRGAAEDLGAVLVDQGHAVHRGAGGPQRGSEPHPVHDGQRGPPDVDGLPAGPRPRRRLDDDRAETAPAQPPRERRPGDTGPADQDVGHTSSSVRCTRRGCRR